MLPPHRDNRIRVLLADDSAIILKAVRMLLADDSEIQVVGVAASNTDLCLVLQKTDPDVLVLDLHMCAGTGVMPGLKEIPGLGLVVISALVGQESMELAARLGIHEVLEKVDLPATLVNAVKTAYSQRHNRRAKAAIAS